MSIHSLLMAAAGGADKLYVDDVFSTYLYTGNGSTQTINNGIDLAGKGGLVWIKDRDTTANDHLLFDTARGATKSLNSTITAAEQTTATSLTALNANGFTLGAYSFVNASGSPNVAWTFRKAAKFFDIVTWTGNGSAPRAISHALGIAPGMVVIKRTDSTGEWWVYHRSSPNGGNLYLNHTDIADSGANPGLSAVSASAITLSTNQNAVLNVNGATYVAYLFAHDTATDGVIQCGSFTTDGSGNATVSLGWEPQYGFFKPVSTTGDWFVMDVARGWADGNSDLLLRPNTSGAETGPNAFGKPNATGFNAAAFLANTTYIYLVIRRPMKTPTSGTQVYNAIARTETQALTDFGFLADFVYMRENRAAVGDNHWFTRLSGGHLDTNSTAAESGTSSSDFSFGKALAGFSPGTNQFLQNVDANNTAKYFSGFRRAPGFMDVVCWTGDSSTVPGGDRALNHNLGTAPQLVIAKIRSAAGDWLVGNSADWTKELVLNSTAAYYTGASNQGFNTPTATTIGVRNNNVSNLNASGNTYVAYLFTTLAGISKVGSYTGNGGSQTIACGFSSGARFVLIKRTDAASDWFVWDTARGIVAGNDPYLFLNSASAEFTGSDDIDPDGSGFIVNQTANAFINANGASYIFLAIA